MKTLPTSDVTFKLPNKKFLHMNSHLNLLNTLSLLFIFLLGGPTISLYSQCDPPAPAYNDPASQDGILELMNIPCAWTLSNGNPNIVVAIADKYLDDSHTDLAGKVILPINDYCDPEDAFEHHGNMCFGAVTAIRNNGVCVTGSGGLTRVAGWCGGANDTNLEDMYEQGYKIVSISAWLGFDRETLEKLTQNGVVVLVAGLNQWHQDYYDVPGVIHVGRAYQNKQFWNYETNGTTNLNLDVLTVTEGLDRISRVNTCEPAGGGTSIGTPLLAGVVALMRDVNPCLSPADIEEILVSTADPIPSNATSANTRAGVIDAYAAVLAAKNFVGQNITWGAGGGGTTIQNAHVSGNLTVFSGGVVTVEGNVYFGNESIVTIQPNSKLVVKGSLNLGGNSSIVVKRGGHLLVDGGKLTKSFCADSWKGIIVEGNSMEAQQLPGSSLVSTKCGIVEIKNNAVIEHAITAVSMKPTHLSWTDQYYGGLIIAENSSFLNNNRSLEFMRYYKYTDKSKFTNVNFDGDGKFIATHWENHGVKYDNCNFSSYQHQAILTWDATISVVNGCVFDNAGHTQFDQASMHLYNTFAGPYASEIGDIANDPNQFFGGYYHVFCTGISNDVPTTVRNNIFLGGITSVYMDGICHQMIEHNDFIGQEKFGNQIVSNGVHENFSSDNNFADLGIGIHTWYDNSKFRFLANCFETINRDYQQFSGAIAEDVGSMVIAASNCFTLPHAVNGDILLIGGAVPFRYHIKVNTPSNSCRRPSYNSFGALIADAQSEKDLNCGSSETVGLIEVPSVPCQIPSDPEDIEEYIDDLEDQLASLNQQLSSATYPSAIWFQIKYQITELEKCVQLANLRNIGERAKLNQLSDLVSFYQSRGFFYKTQVYGAMLFNTNYSLARTYLTNLTATNEEEVDFKFIQDINLARLEDRNYVLSPSDSTQLRIKAMKTFPYAGYGRALYFLLTGKKLILDLPYEDEVLPRSLPSDQSDINNFKAYPNPAIDQLILESSLPAEQDWNVKLIDNQGRIVKEVQMIRNSRLLNVGLNGIEPGLYFLTVGNESTGQRVFEFKLVKLQ